jgi:hypothetical protein
MLAGVISWLVLDRTVLKDAMPHPLWLAVFTNVFIFVVGYLLSCLPSRGTVAPVPPELMLRSAVPSSDPRPRKSR